MNRRGFLGGLAGILAAGVAPVVMPAGILMPTRKLLLPTTATGDFTIELWTRSQKDAESLVRLELVDCMTKRLDESLMRGEKGKWVNFSFRRVGETVSYEHT